MKDMKNMKDMKTKKTKKCLTCIATTKKNAYTTHKQADWKTKRGLKTIFPNDYEPELTGLRKKQPVNADTKVIVNLGKKYADRFILYYAALTKKDKYCAETLSADIAYDKFQNQGISKTNKDGNAELFIKCPQSYKEYGRAYPPHVHFIVASKGNKKWEKKTITKTVYCDVCYKDMKKAIDSGCSLIINSLPIEYFIKDSIPMSVPLPYKLLEEKKLSGKEVKSYLKKMLVHCPKIHKAVKSGKMRITEVPIIVYCYNRNCNASNICGEELVNLGFTNVKLYEEGIVGWNKHK